LFTFGGLGTAARTATHPRYRAAGQGRTRGAADRHRPAFCGGAGLDCDAVGAADGLLPHCLRAAAVEPRPGRFFHRPGPAAPLAAKLRTSRPEMEVRLVEAQPQRCLDLLLSERIDLAVIVASQSQTGTLVQARFEQTVLLDDPLDVVLPADHRLAMSKSVSL